MKKYNNYNIKISNINKRKVLIKKVEDLSFDADFGFNVFNAFLNNNNIFKGEDIPNIPQQMTTKQLESFIDYYNIQLSINSFNI